MYKGNLAELLKVSFRRGFSPRQLLSTPMQNTGTLPVESRKEERYVNCGHVCSTAAREGKKKAKKASRADIRNALYREKGAKRATMLLTLSHN
jgi:hypothetical protein